MAGDEGFEPPIMGPEPTALPLGQSPIKWIYTSGYRVGLYKKSTKKSTSCQP